jgi:hypothetical protein
MIKILKILAGCVVFCNFYFLYIFALIPDRRNKIARSRQLEILNEKGKDFFHISSLLLYYLMQKEAV